MKGWMRREGGEDLSVKRGDSSFHYSSCLFTSLPNSLHSHHSKYTNGMRNYNRSKRKIATAFRRSPRGDDGSRGKKSVVN